MPFICGGYNGEWTDSCHKYDFTSDEWQLSGTMTEERGYSGFASSDSWGLVMAGGNNDNPDFLSTVATTLDGEAFGSLPNLPEISGIDEGNDESCVVIIDRERIFTCGGYQLSSYTFIYYSSTNSWTKYNNFYYHENKVKCFPNNPS